MIKIMVCVLALLSLGGCALIGAGIIGAAVESNHRQYCAYQPFDPNCRGYWYEHRRWHR